MTNDFAAGLESLRRALASAAGGQQELIPDNGDKVVQTTQSIAADKERALYTLRVWRTNARAAKKKEAEAECDFLIKFISAICG